MAYRGSNINLGSSTSPTGLAPSGVQAGDRLLAFIAIDGPSVTFTPPSGWTEIGNITVATPDGHTWAAFEKKVATGTDDYVWTSSSGNSSQILTVAYSDRSATAAAIISSDTNATGNSSPFTVTVPALTALAGDDMCWAATLDITSADAVWSFTPPTGYTERIDSASASWCDSTLATKDNQSSGSTGAVAGDATYVSGTGTTAGWMGFLISIPSGVRITAQPGDINVVNGQTATFSVNATQGATFQWQDNSSGSFANIGGATSATYTTAATTSSFQRRKYRCTVSGTNSSEATLTLSWHDVYLYAMPEDVDPDDVRLRDPTVFSGAGGITAVAVDTLTVTDSAVANVSFTTAAVDTLTVSDSAVSQTDRVCAATDTVTFSDSAVSGVQFPAVAVDTVSFTDSAVSGVQFPAVAVDSITLTDSAVAASNLTVAAVDTLTLSDSAVASSNLVVVAVDTLTVSDSAIANSSLVAVAVDTLTVTDSAVASISTGAITAVAADTISFSDSAVASSNLTAAASDTITLSDSAVASSNLAAVAVDTVAFTDSAIGALVSTTAAVAVDSITFTDSAVCARPSTDTPSGLSIGGGRGPSRSSKKFFEELNKTVNKLSGIPEPVALVPAVVKPVPEKLVEEIAAQLAPVTKNKKPAPIVFKSDLIKQTPVEEADDDEEMAFVLALLL